MISIRFSEQGRKEVPKVKGCECSKHRNRIPNRVVFEVVHDWLNGAESRVRD
jgi:hypothetical protein